MAQVQDQSTVDRDRMRAAATGGKLVEARQKLARFTSETFAKTGNLLHAFGHVVE